MQAPLLPHDLLEFMTLRMRHAVSNGEYLTVDMLEDVIAEYARDHADEAPAAAVLH